jgi:hypothetical protein
LHEKLGRVYNEVTKRSGKKADARKAVYDRRVKVVEFKTGEKILLRREGCPPGLNVKWRRPYSGPWIIEARRGPVNYLVRRLPNGKQVVAHVDKIRPYPPGGLTARPTETYATADGLDEPDRRSNRLRRPRN